MIVYMSSQPTIRVENVFPSLLAALFIRFVNKENNGQQKWTGSFKMKSFNFAKKKVLKKFLKNKNKRRFPFLFSRYLFMANMDILVFVWQKKVMDNSFTVVVLFVFVLKFSKYNKYTLSINILQIHFHCFS